MIIKEACIENVSQAISAEKNGATQLEVCSQLDVGGLTPTDELILEIKKAVSIPMHVMIRPRAGNFHYDIEELEKMIRSITFCKENNIEGVVFGVTKENKELDCQAIEELSRYSQPLKVTIHKAIDETPDPVKASQSLTKIEGITEILTSGGMPTAIEGSETIKRMIKATGDQIRIKAAGKITYKNFKQIHDLVKAEAYHGRNIVEGL